jgi:hypothetical protein
MIEYGVIDSHPSCQWRVFIDYVRFLNLDGELSNVEVEKMAIAELKLRGLDENSTIIIEKW